MQVEAIYSKGRIEFIQPLRLRHDPVRVFVNVPDDEVEPLVMPLALSAQTLAQAQTQLDHYRAILTAPYPVDDELLELSAEYQARLEAMDFRAQSRQQQGKPV